MPSLSSKINGTHKNFIGILLNNFESDEDVFLCTLLYVFKTFLNTLFIQYSFTRFTSQLSIKSFSDNSSASNGNRRSQTSDLDDEDVTAKIVGDFGKWQLKISILMSLLKLSNAWYQLNIMFMAPSQEFWCAKPKFFEHLSDREWRDICAPVSCLTYYVLDMLCCKCYISIVNILSLLQKIEEFPCLIYDPVLLSTYMDRSLIPLVTCNEFVYDTSVFQRTIISDWNLVCDKHWLTHVGVLHDFRIEEFIETARRRNLFDFID